MGSPLPSVRLAIFQGPLDVLLRRIQEQKLDITELSLVAVTRQFLAHAQGMGTDDGPLLAAFLRVAAQLMHLKSRALLHEPPEPEDEAAGSLEDQLRGYERFRQLMTTVAAWEEGRGASYQRTAPTPLPAFAPPALVGYAPEDLVGALAAVLEEKEDDLPTVARRTVHIETYLARIDALLTRHGRTGFRAVIEPAQSLEEIVVAFLAVLEFLRLGKAAVRQDALYADICILPANPARAAHSSDTANAAPPVGVAPAVNAAPATAPGHARDAFARAPLEGG